MPHFCALPTNERKEETTTSAGTTRLTGRLRPHSAPPPSERGIWQSELSGGNISTISSTTPFAQQEAESIASALVREYWKLEAAYIEADGDG
ncbi:hypothetical protein OC834_007814, partial [Tilletia horrida]